MISGFGASFADCDPRIFNIKWLAIRYIDAFLHLEVLKTKYKLCNIEFFILIRMMILPTLLMIGRYNSILLIWNKNCIMNK
ncbi:hypothetical protein CN380_22955 [Bacillus sp. AFS017274]|nr:hypothetical protein CN380_22955 [Bacillus sp. AFS017274]